MKQKTIALIDSGVGGLSILAPLKSALPYNDFLYYSDGCNLPYGDKSQAELCAIAERIVCNVCDKFKVDIFVLACNTLTAGAIEHLRVVFKDKIFVGCEPNLSVPYENGKKSPLVLCTPFTQSSQRITSRFGAKAAFLSAPLLAEMIEREEDDSSIKKYLLNLLPLQQAQKYDCIVLGCTHYFLKKQLIEDLFALPVYTSVDGVIKRVLHFVFEKNALCTFGNPIICFWETGKEDKTHSVLRFWKKL